MEQKIVTRSDCDQVIQKCVGNDKFEIVNFKIKPFEDKDREYYKPDCILEISAKITRNISRFRFFLKRFVTEYPALNELLVAARSSEREILFYKHFLPMLRDALDSYETDFVPDYFYSQENRLMIVEDMYLKFFTLARKSNPHWLDRFHISLALRAIAKLHAAALAYEEKFKEPEASRLFDDKDLLSQEPVWRNSEDFVGRKKIEAGVKGLQTLLKLVQGGRNDKLDELVQQTYNLMRPQAKYRNVLCHGDLHTKNILFKYDKNNIANECVLLNFGFCRYFLPAYDVLTLIFTSTNRLFRQHYFTYLIQYYHDCLHNELMKQELHINEVLTFEDFERSINYLMPAIKLQALLHLQDFGAKSGFYKPVQRDERLYHTYMFEDNSFFIQDLYNKDPVFKDLVVEMLEELLEIIRTPQVTRENCYKVLETQFGTTVYDLKSFKVSAIPDVDPTLFELTLEASDGQKEKTVNAYKYLVNCGLDHCFKIHDSL